MTQKAISVAMRIAFAALFLMAAQIMNSSLTFAADSAPSSAAKLDERVLGDAKAPITVIEYASLTCSHCAHFHNNTLPELKKLYIDTGKIRLIFRDFPNDARALLAAKLSRCLSPTAYFPFISLLMQHQKEWAFSKTEAELYGYASQAGLSREAAKACVEQKPLEDFLLQRRLEAEQKYKITGTPAFIINEGQEVISGSQPVQKFAATFDRLLEKKDPAAPAPTTPAPTPTKP